jgi:hypothetical protein
MLNLFIWIRVKGAWSPWKMLRGRAQDTKFGYLCAEGKVLSPFVQSVVGNCTDWATPDSYSALMVCLYRLIVYLQYIFSECEQFITMHNFSFWGWSTSNVESYPTFRQTFQLPSSVWVCFGWALLEALYLTGCPVEVFKKRSINNIHLEDGNCDVYRNAG